MRAKGSVYIGLAVGTLAFLSATPAVAQDDVFGRWDLAQPMTWNDRAINGINLPTNKVLLWESAHDEIDEWDPIAATLTPRDAHPGEIFLCAGHAPLINGRVIVAGGTGPQATVHEFQLRGMWADKDPMIHARFYPTLLTMPDGRILALGGTNVVVPEIYDPSNPEEPWTEISSATQDIGEYPFAFILPDGNVGVVGAHEGGTSAQIVKVLDLSLQSPTWSNGPMVIPGTWTGHGGSAVMYEPGVVLRAGGIDAQTNQGTPFANIIDFNQTPPTVASADQMMNVRNEFNMVVLPDGHVLAVGGFGVFQAEWVDPHAPIPTWKPLASMTQPRDHHSIAVLLANGSVLAAGFPGIERGEIFSPPYLFKGPRPTVTSVPAVINYGVDFSIEVPSETSPILSEDIDRVTLLRPGSTTHGFDQNQRFIELSFSQSQFPADPDILILTPPANANVAPPGYYMLFVLSDQGVPSKAAFVQLVE